MFCLLPLIGSGTFLDPYRADVPKGVLAHSAHIPTDSDGVPIYLDAPVSFDADLIIPPSITSSLRGQQMIRELMLARDEKAVLEAMIRPSQLRDAQMYLPGDPLLIDSFNRADSGDLGVQWDGGYTLPTADPLALRSNAAGMSVVSGNDNYESYNAAALPNDQWAEATLRAIVNAGGRINAPRVCLRCTPPTVFTNYQYMPAVNIAGQASTIAKVIAGAYTLLSSEGVTSWVAGNSFRGEVVGSSHSLYRNGSQTALLTASDSAIPSGTRAGIILYVDPGGSVTDSALGDFMAGPGSNAYVMDDDTGDSFQLVQGF